MPESGASNRIVLYAGDGLHDTEVAVRLDTTAAIVGKWRKRVFTDRVDWYAAL